MRNGDNPGTDLKLRQNSKFKILKFCFLDIFFSGSNLSQVVSFPTSCKMQAWRYTKRITVFYLHDANRSVIIHCLNGVHYISNHMGIFRWYFVKLTHFWPIFSVLYPLKLPENQSFASVCEGIRKGKMGSGEGYSSHAIITIFLNAFQHHGANPAVHLR